MLRRVLYLSSSRIPSSEANSVHVMQMSQALSDYSELSLMVYPGSKKEQNLYRHYGVIENFRLVFYYKNHTIGLRRHLIKFLNIVKEIHKADFVIGRNLWGCLISTFCGKPTIFESHDLIWNHSILTKVLFRLILKKPYFTKLILISNRQKELYLNKYKDLLKDKIEVLHDGANIENRTEQRHLNFVFDSSQKNVGYVGSIYQGRGIDLIISIARKLKDIQFHVVGGDLKDFMKLNDYDSSIPNNIIFHGRIEPQHIPSLLTKFDILLAPYQKTVKIHGNKGNTVEFMSPLKIFEYMSSKTPMIVSELSVLKEILTSEEAIFARPESVEDWVSKIQDLLLNEQKQFSLGNNAFKKLAIKYTWKARAGRIIELFTNDIK